VPHWRENVLKYAHLMWWGALGVLVSLCLGSIIWIMLSGRAETEHALKSGRRLLIALETGEITGKLITLDVPSPEPLAEKPETVVPETVPVEKLPADVPATETSPGEVPSPDEKVVPQSNVAPTKATPTPEPNPALSEKSEFGNLPVISKDGLRPWRYYSKAFERKRNQPMIAIIVTGLGTGREITQDVLELPEYVTLSFSPYASDIMTWSAAVRATGHELLIDVPLEPTDYPATDPGPKGLLLEKGPEEDEKRLQWVLSRFPAFIGIMTPRNEAFTANDEAMKVLLQSVANRGLLLVLSHEPARKETRDILDASHTPAIVATLSIDEELSPTAIQTRLAQLEEQARKNGYAIGVAGAYPLTIQQLKEWAQTLSEKGVVLVPASAIAKLRFS
jgi:polysaccharide deacetylase 2 family uncharacterized protein YibQ